MSSKFSFGKIQFDLAPGREAARVDHDSETPFCLALLGDFSGCASRGLVEPLTLRKPWKIDLDNLDRIMERLEISLPLPDR